MAIISDYLRYLCRLVEQSMTYLASNPNLNITNWFT